MQFFIHVRELDNNVDNSNNILLCLSLSLNNNTTIDIAKMYIKVKTQDHIGQQKFSNSPQCNLKLYYLAISRLSSFF